jgi:hypothetical protein
MGLRANSHLQYSPVVYPTSYGHTDSVRVISRVDMAEHVQRFVVVVECVAYSLQGLACVAEIGEDCALAVSIVNIPEYRQRTHIGMSVRARQLAQRSERPALGWLRVRPVC